MTQSASDSAGLPETTDVAANVARGVIRLLSDMGVSAITEMPLRNGRRVDVMGIGRDGRITVIEVKSCEADFRADRKWPEYLTYCDLFYFAVPEGFPLAILPEEPGLMVADRFDAVVLRPAPETAMNASRRRNVTLRFARAAADRLVRATDQRL